MWFKAIHSSYRNLDSFGSIVPYQTSHGYTARGYFIHQTEDDEGANLSEYFDTKEDCEAFIKNLLSEFLIKNC